MFIIKIWRGTNINHSNLHSVRDISVFCRFLCHIINSYLLNFPPSGIYIVNLRKIFFRNNKFSLFISCISFSRDPNRGIPLTHQPFGALYWPRFVIHTISYSSIGCYEHTLQILVVNKVQSR